jgi:aldehyde dehydrogenase
VTGRLIMRYAADNVIPSTTELGGKSPTVFFADVMAADDDFLDKAVEGFVLYAFNKGEVCTCPSRALVEESIYDRFMEWVIARVEAIRQGDPLDPATMIGPQVLIGGRRTEGLPSEISGGYYFEPTVHFTTRVRPARSI